MEGFSLRSGQGAGSGIRFTSRPRQTEGQVFGFRFGQPPRFRVVPAVGGGGMTTLVSVAIGWGLDYVARWDDDKDGRDGFNAATDYFGPFESQKRAPKKPLGYRIFESKRPGGHLLEAAANLEDRIHEPHHPRESTPGRVPPLEPVTLVDEYEGQDDIGLEERGQKNLSVGEDQSSATNDRKGLVRVHQREEGACTVRQEFHQPKEDREGGRQSRVSTEVCLRASSGEPQDCRVLA